MPWQKLILPAFWFFPGILIAIGALEATYVMEHLATCMGQAKWSILSVSLSREFPLLAVHCETEK
jgi:hypothetical protein